MNKKEFIAAVAEKTGFTKKDTGILIDGVIDVITKALVNGEDVKLAGFGSFTTIERAAREGRNPQTGETMTIEARRSPKFKPSKTLREVVAK